MSLSSSSPTRRAPRPRPPETPTRLDFMDPAAAEALAHSGQTGRTGRAVVRITPIAADKIRKPKPSGIGTPTPTPAPAAAPVAPAADKVPDPADAEHTGCPLRTGSIAVRLADRGDDRKQWIRHTDPYLFRGPTNAQRRLRRRKLRREEARRGKDTRQALAGAII